MDNAIWQRTTPNQKTVMMTILMMVYFAPAPWTWKGKPYLVQPGQIITKVSDILALCGPGISRQTVRTTIQKLKINQLIAVESTSHGMLITLENGPFWRFYDSESTSQIDENQPANQPESTSTPNKQILNKQILKKDIGEPAATDYPYIENSRVLESFICFIDYLKEAGKDVTTISARAKYRRLVKLSQSPDEQIKIIEQSIEKGWLALYPISKGFTATNQKSPKGNFEQRDYNPDYLETFYENVNPDEIDLEIQQGENQE